MASYPSIRIEGGLLGPELLDQLVAGDLSGQKSVDFGLEARRNLTDEIAAVFADARALWGVFQNRLGRIDPDDPATTITREWVISLMGLLGYGLVYNQRAHEIDGMTFAVSHRAGEAEDAPAVHIVGARQELGRLAPSGRPRLAPHSLVQEYLNRTEHVWGLVTNGTTLRVIRDSTLVRRQAYVEFDLAGIFDEQRFLDFVAFYRLLHRTRLPKGLTDAGECLLETYYAHSVEQGGRVRDHLRDGVEECIERLANGFLTHPKNDELRRRLDEKKLTEGALYRELLRLIYRFLFLLVSEDRGLLSPNPIYREHYGVARLRKMLDRRSAFTDHDDLWHGLRLLWQVFGKEEWAAMLELAPLNGELFGPQTLDGCSISNRDLLSAFWYLAFYQESASAPARRVNYGALDVEELGSVYESLLEFHPAINRDAQKRLTFRLIYGSERKTTGSYYTPPALVNELIQSALLPVIQDRIKAAGKVADATALEKALLSLRVCDDACGSGHFLLAAARRIGKELARVRTGEDEPAPERVREAVRDAIAHCIYGVDKNPLAVDLCRVALWIESHTAGKPLSFLDHRIRCGDSLVGVFDLDVLGEGIPDKAFDLLEGDDKVIAREAMVRNRDEKKGIRDLFAWNSANALKEIGKHSQSVDAIADDSPAHVRRKREVFEASHQDPGWRLQKEACDLWTATFFQRLTDEKSIITSGALAERMAGRPILPQLLALAVALSHKYRFFHWPLEFPEVFAGGGFDVILSNPPWEHVELKEQEFFAARDASIADAPNKAVRTRMIKALSEGNPVLREEYVDALRGFDGSRLFLATSGRYPLCGRGRINTYAVFAELNRALVRSGGRAGIIVQSDIATSDTCKFFFQSLFKKQSLVSFFDFVNTEGIFPAVHRTHPHFCLLTMSGSAVKEAPVLSFWNTNTGHLRDDDRRFILTGEDISLLNPNTGNCPIFRGKRDAELMKAIYRRVPVLLHEGKANGNPWNLSFNQGLFNLSSDSHHFRTAVELTADGYRREGGFFVSAFDRYIPLYEAKMIHQFDHRWATYGDGRANARDGRSEDTDSDARAVTGSEKCDPAFVAQSRYWVREEVVESAIPKYPEPVAMALALGHKSSLQFALLFWVGGYHFNRGESSAAAKAFASGLARNIDEKMDGFRPDIDAHETAAAMERMFPLTAKDVAAIQMDLDEPEDVARELVRRHSPQWFLGWRDITNSTNERTLIASAVPRVAVGNSLPLMMMPGIKSVARICCLAVGDSFVVDYVARQKVGGTHINYFYMKQFPILRPGDLVQPLGFGGGLTVEQWLFPRVLELVYTAHDLVPLARDCGYEEGPFSWECMRRFEIRCELDAAIFHLYLPADATGEWRKVEGESQEQLNSLKVAFPLPKDAVAHILDQFPIVRERDESAHGCYRTKERIMEIYDAMLVAQSNGRTYKSTLNPPPGER
jgi:hypothetical protein